ncbi:hypothetical protein [Nonomuraea sediminis]|uniref:hypothetical protein n=1 Tax=Nonomuraea sediminis TaxID=2835864 RepID=UPI001BDCBC8F|nr:hypothetical protein [Nonomuraea sediminis]
MEPEEPKGSERGRVLELVEKVSSFAVPLAVGLYAMLYIGYQDVYEVFGITPEQAGLEQATVFARLLSTLVQVFLWLLPCVGFVVGVGWLINKVTRGAAGRMINTLRELPWVAATFAALLSAAGYWAYFVVNGAPDLDANTALLLAAIVALFGLFIPYRMMRRTSTGRAGTKVLTGVLVGMGLGFFLNIMMVQGAHDIYVNGNGNEFLKIVGFKNQWATVHDGDNKPVLKDDDRALVLGEMEGAYVLYNCGTQETVRRPVEATLLGQIELDPDFSNGGKDKVEPCGYATEEGQ